MPVSVTWIDDPFAPTSWERAEVESFTEALVQRYPVWPRGARIYHGNVAAACDVTPSDAYGVERLQKLPGPFWVVIHPGEPTTIIIAVVAVVVAVAAAYFLRPEIPTVSVRDPGSTSPNNELGARENRPRIGGRIPDIYGTVRSTPDLVAVPYRVFEGHKEVEYSYMCVGRGAFEILDIRENSTPITDILGTDVAVYSPNTSPNSGDLPQLLNGEQILEPIYNVKRFSSVESLILRPPNYKKIEATNVIFEAGGFRVPGVDHSDYFEAGDVVTITGATVTGYGTWNPYTGQPTGYSVNTNLDGTYTVLEVTSYWVKIGPWSYEFLYAGTRLTYIPSAAWIPLLSFGIGEDPNPCQPVIQAGGGDGYVGPFTVDIDTTDQVWINIVGPNGLYKDGTGASGLNVDIRIELTPVNSNGTPIGSPETFDATIDGSLSKTARGITVKANPTFTGRCEVRVKRLTNTDYGYTSGNYVDEIRWRDLYSVSNITRTHFGDVTTVQTRAYAGDDTANKSRKLTLLVQRKLEQISSGVLGLTKVGTNRACDSLAHLCLDSKIGNRTLAEVDLANFESVYNAIVAYFGSALAGEFNYTFDSTNMSFEESVSTLADVIFSHAYRRGFVIRLSFEKLTPDSVLLFNHRNKLPGTESRTVRFGTPENVDGIEFQYVDPNDDAIISYHIPSNQNALHPKKVESVGIRSRLQAHFHAWRTWAKLQYQNVTAQFDATQESDILLLGDRVLVADNTRPSTQDGEVLSQNGLELTLSQQVQFEIGHTYTIFLQHTDGTVESLGVTAGSFPNKVILSGAPRLPLALNRDLFARAGYLIVDAVDTREKAFLLVEKKPRSNFINEIKVVNYDSRYYSADRDLIDGVVLSDGTYNSDYEAGLAVVITAYGTTDDALVILNRLATLANTDLPTSIPGA